MLVCAWSVFVLWDEAFRVLSFPLLKDAPLFLYQPALPREIPNWVFVKVGGDKE